MSRLLFLSAACDHPIQVTHEELVRAQSSWFRWLSKFLCSIMKKLRLYTESQEWLLRIGADAAEMLTQSESDSVATHCTDGGSGVARKKLSVHPTTDYPGRESGATPDGSIFTVFNFHIEPCSAQPSNPNERNSSLTRTIKNAQTPKTSKARLKRFLVSNSFYSVDEFLAFNWETAQFDSSAGNGLRLAKDE
ncbi:hypothetical protein J6590_053803 [Homalodisca vitripennis]|nr:hypothetical protein J6590_053803 [Homalodisca vitripennis]